MNTEKDNVDLIDVSSSKVMILMAKSPYHINPSECAKKLTIYIKQHVRLTNWASPTNGVNPTNFDNPTNWADKYLEFP